MSTSNLLDVQYLYLICSILRLIFERVFPVNFLVKYYSPPLETIYTFKMIFYISFLSILLYVLMNGFGGFSNGYETRYDSAKGSGLLLLFFPAFLVLCSYELLNAKQVRKFLLVAVKYFIFSLIIFYVLNGYRQLTIAVALNVVLFAIYKKLIPQSTALFLFSLFFGIALLILMSFIRYSGESNSEFYNASEAAFYYVQGDLFPVDAVMKILYYTDIYEPPGFSVIYNHILKFVPRFLWQEKPEIILNSAGYYTIEILEYKRRVTLSPTIISNGLLVKGFIGVAFVFSAAQLLCGLIDKYLINSTSIMVFTFSISYLYMGFFLVREGVESAIYRVICLFIYLFIAVIFTNFIKFIR